MDPKLKKFFAFFMAAADLLLLPFFLIDGISTGDTISWFLTAFFAIDTYLTIDYINELTKKINEEQHQAQNDSREYARNLAKAQYSYMKQQEEDRQMAAAIREAKEVEEMDPDELHDLLSGQTVETFEHEEKHMSQQ